MPKPWGRHGRLPARPWGRHVGCPLRTTEEREGRQHACPTPAFVEGTWREPCVPWNELRLQIRPNGAFARQTKRRALIRLRRIGPRALAGSVASQAARRPAVALVFFYFSISYTSQKGRFPSSQCLLTLAPPKGTFENRSNPALISYWILYEKPLPRKQTL